MSALSDIEWHNAVTADMRDRALSDVCAQTPADGTSVLEDLPSWRADGVARAAASLLSRLAVPIARAAAPFVAASGWFEAGYARQDDYAREVLFRTGRWLRQMAELGRAIAKWPALEQALDGRDGARPLGAIAALEVARVADDASLATWIAAARSMTIRALRDAIRGATPAGGASTGETSPCEADDGCDVRVHLPVPAGIRGVFDDTLELHRRVVGHEATVADFVEALCAETGAGPVGPPDDVQVSRVRTGSTRADRERRAESRGGVDWAAPWANDDVYLERMEREIAGARDLFASAGTGSAPELGRQLAALVDLEAGLRRLIGRVLALLRRRRGWARFGCADAGHYAETRLGIARSTAEDLLAVTRLAQSEAAFGDEYEAGLLRTSAAAVVARVLRRISPNDPRRDRLVGDWVLHAEGVTIKRLRDEASFEIRAARTLGTMAAPCPLDDREWRAVAALAGHTDPDAIARAARSAAETGGELDDELALRLDEDLAKRFLATLDRAAADVLGGGGPIRMFSAEELFRFRWLGLVYALSCYASTWAPRGGARSAPARCDAPGCTARAELQLHHVRYRSQGGTDDPSNMVPLCAFHHLRGEHGGLMQVRGTAPDDLAYRLGPQGSSAIFRNETRVIDRPRTE